MFLFVNVVVPVTTRLDPVSSNFIAGVVDGIVTLSRINLPFVVPIEEATVPVKFDGATGTTVVVLFPFSSELVEQE